MVPGANWRHLSSSLLTYGTLAVLVILATFPLYWMVVTSLKQPREVFQRENMLIVQNPTLDNYIHVIVERPALLWIGNSTLVASVASIAAVLISALAAYSLVRLRYPGKQLLIRVVVLSYLVPHALLFIPLFVIYYELGFQNSRPGLMLVYVATSLPFMTWFLMGYVKGIPKELEEAGLIDGCGHLSVFFRIVLPLMLPGLIAVWIFGFTVSWNEYVMANLLITNADLRTVPLGMVQFLVADLYQWGPLMSMSVLATLPTVILYMIAQRFLIQGMTSGAVKG
jgi:multiple sugar transport system permease protein